MSNSNATITLKARTDEFEARLKKAIGTFESLTLQGKNTTKAIDDSMRQLTISSKGYVDKLEQSFNALQIKPDIALEYQTKLLAANVRVIEGHYQKIAKDADRSTAEVTRAFKAMNDKIRQYNEQPLKSSFSTLGILPTSAVEAEKSKIIEAFEEIKRVGTDSPGDITRAYEKMVTDLRRLDDLLLTDSEKVHNEALAMNKRFNEERIASDKRVYDAKIAAQRANHLAYERDEEDAFRINEKFNEAKIAADKRLYEAKIAVQRANHLAYERDEEEAFRIHERFISERIASEKRLAVAQAEALAMNKRFNEERIASEKAANIQLEEVRKKPFETLKIMSSSDINAEKAKIVAAFNDIKNSGEKSGTDVKRAYASMNAELKRLKELSSGDPARNATKGINLLSLASTAAIVKIQLLYSLVNTTMSVIGSIPRIAMDAVESFEASSISGAAIITSMQKGVKDVGEAYKENKAYVEATQEALIKMDTQTAASGKNLEDMNHQFRLQGVLLDSNNEKQKQGFLNIANALSALTANDPNRDMQFSQEISAFVRGEDRTGNKLFKLLNSLDNGNLKESLKLWKENSKEADNYGLIIEKAGAMLDGFKVAQDDINKLWETQKSTLATIRDEILRDGFGPEFDKIIAKLTEVNEYGIKNKDAIAKMISGGFENIHSVINTLETYSNDIMVLGGLLVVAKVSQLELNAAVKANPYVAAGAALLFLNEQMKHLNIGFGEQDLSLGGLVDKYNVLVYDVEKLAGVYDNNVDKAEALRNEIDALSQSLAAGSTEGKKWYDFKLFADPKEDQKHIEETVNKIKVLQAELERVLSLQNAINNTSISFPDPSKFGGVYAPPPPKNINFGGSEDDAASGAGNGDKLLRAAERLNEKLAELQKSHNEIILSENANARKYELQEAENNYDERIISLSAYIKKKQDIEVAAIEEEIRTQQETVAAFQKVLDTGNFGYGGDKGAADKVEAQIKLNNAIKDLKNSEAELAVIRLKNHNELSKYNREETDYVKNVNIQYNEYAGNFVAAEKLRQESLAYTNELLRLQQAAIEDVAGAQQALEAFKVQGEIDLKMAGLSEDQNRKSLISNMFGTNSEVDAIVDRYAELYNQLEAIEIEKGKASLEYKSVFWGSAVDMARNSVDTITGLLMSGNEKQFKAGKALAISMAVVNAALAVTKAMTTLSWPMSLFAAAQIGAATGIQIATIASQQYEGRALGGPVIAGQTYIVNENRRTEGPEYFTPGVSGVITPASKLRDASADDRESRITNVNQRIYVQGSVDNRTASQIARDTERKQRIAQVRFG